ncbi:MULTISPECIES: hypothetical protein [Maribacter]|uniref:Uncharacterized protein n=1 Tax=Maribacter flavus TaxID=1658664 RepID=A0ABU7IH92_9FLAO|nr:MULTISPECIES: hypothetical protein [Maribacter]MDC6404898.1 hypothetical protein [Maribacter sp. PR66]MEE1972312.1 hypothetical protein [Maribacter flavus]
MKKLAAIVIIFLGILTVSSCDYDDSNDLDILRPNDSTQTGLTNSV